MLLDCGRWQVLAVPVLVAEGREWTLPDPQATVSAPLGDTRSERASWTGRLRLVLDAEPVRQGWRLSVRVEALRPLTVDRIGVRLTVGDAARVLVDGYHSWDWAGTRDATVPGSGWWSAMAGRPGDSSWLRLGLSAQAAAGALAISWDGGGTFAVVTSGEPLQAGERTGAARDLGVSLQAREAFASDRIDLIDADAGATEPPGRSRVAAAPRRRRAGWMSWNCLGAAVGISDVLDARDLLPAGGVVLVDDGWMERWGDWREAPRLGASMPELAAELARTGHDLGLWLAPFLVDPDSDTALEHPDWLLRDAEGAPVLDQRPGRPQWVLDATHREVADHLRTLGVRLGAAGARVVKPDFLYAGALPGVRPPGWSGIRALSQGIGALTAGFRSAAGGQGQVWACGAPGPAVAGIVDCCRSGGDAVVRVPGLETPAPDPPIFVHGPAILRAQARNLAARSWLWGTTLPCDVDAVTLGRVGSTAPVDPETLEAWLRMVRRSGGPLLNSDVPSTLDPSRRARLRDELTLPLRDPERPVDPLELSPAPAVDDDFLSWAPSLPEAWEPM